MSREILELYCQYLLVSPVNYTCTNLADHTPDVSHDRITRYLATAALRPRDLWAQVKRRIHFSGYGYILFDDRVLPKIYSTEIVGVRRQYCGSAHGVIRGIGTVNCVYYDPIGDEFWLIDYRIFDPERDGKTKIDHVLEMLNSLRHRRVLFSAVLMDSWYATVDIMKAIMALGKTFYCPIKSNRKVDDSGGQTPYRRVDALAWTPAEEKTGKTIKLWKFPKDTRLKLFRVAVDPDRTDYLVTNDLTQQNTTVAAAHSDVRWKVEEFHRESSQLTGIGKCQCRRNRAQRNHIAAAHFVWIFLKQMAYHLKKTIYKLKKDLLDAFLIQQLKNPTIKFEFA